MMTTTPPQPTVQRPTQAVILAGGRGSRLRPLTDSRPKPMIEFQGKPFLGHLLELVREQGFKRVLLLLGYLPQAIQAYCGDGSRWGLAIESTVSAVEDDTGRRLKLAASRLDPTFFLFYCDNYWPLPCAKIWQRYLATGAEAMLTVYDNRDQYTKNNVQLDEAGRILTYDKDRTQRGLSGVEIGYAVLRRAHVESLPQTNCCFEREVYPRLAAEQKLWAFVTGHRYYSISSHERLPMTEEFFARRPALIVDRDGVLNARPPRAAYVRSWAEWRWLPGALEALRLFNEAGFRVLVVSNQAGIARGAMTQADVEAIHAQMKHEVQEAGGRIDAIYYCPHGWDSSCACRKPKPGMLFQAQRDFHLDLSRTYFLGDDERDGQAADAAGCLWMPVSDNHSLMEAAHAILEELHVSR